MFLLAIYSYVGVPILMGIGLLFLVAGCNEVQRNNRNNFDRKIQENINRIEKRINKTKE